jgi:hypothetical protein
MNDPKRLIDQCDSELEWALLREGRRSNHNEARRLQVLAAVGVGAAVTAGAKTSWALAATWQKLLLGGVAVCSGVGGGVLAVQGYRAMHPPAQAASANTHVTNPQLRPQEQLGAGSESEPPSGAQPAGGSQASVEQGAEPNVEQGAAVPAEGAPVASLSRRRVSERGVAASGGSLREEVAVLDRARVAARAGRSTEALTLVDSYMRDFPQGSLRLEAEVVRVQALAAAGRRSEASLRAKKLLAQSPNSVVASRLRGYVQE